MSISAIATPSGHTGSTNTRCVKLNFTDTTKAVHVPEGTPVIEAAEAAGVRLISQCRSGSCGTCVGRVSDGDLHMPEGRVYPLRQDEIDDGMRLLCQAHAVTDAAVELDYAAAMLDDNPVVNTTVKLTGIRWLAQSVAEVTVRVPKSVRFSFRAGQYVRFRVPGTDEWRSYSMASGERAKRQLVFTVRILGYGTMSEYLRGRASVGDTLEMEGPMGSFGLSTNPGPTLMVAGGTGLAPMLSMLETLHTSRHREPIQLIFGCAREADLFHLDELEGRQSFLPNLSVRVVADEPAERPDVLLGNPASVLGPDDVADSRTSAYLCGPPAMLDAVRNRLHELGLPPEQIHSEQFLPS